VFEDDADLESPVTHGSSRFDRDHTRDHRRHEIERDREEGRSKSFSGERIRAREEDRDRFVAQSPSIPKVKFLLDPTTNLDSFGVISLNSFLLAVIVIVIVIVVPLQQF